MSAPNLIHGKFCYVILTSSHDANGYIPCIAVEGDEYMYPMSGNGPHASPWYWGKEYDKATAVAREANARMGITLERELAIMMAAMKSMGRRRHHARA